MNYILTQIFICLLLAALLGMIFGWLLCKSKCTNKTHTTKPDNKNKAETKDTKLKNSTSTKETSSRELSFLNSDKSKYNATTKDNLQLVKGIGATLEKALNEIGVYKFDQIASWTPEQSAQVDETIAFPGRIEREDWVAQCKKLQYGDSTEFSKRVEEGKVPTSKA